MTRLVRGVASRYNMGFFLCRDGRNLVIFPFFRYRFLFAIHLSAYGSETQERRSATMGLPITCTAEGEAERGMRGATLSVSSLPTREYPFII